VLVIVIALHVPLLMALRNLSAPLSADAAPATVVRVEFLLRPSTPVAPRPLEAALRVRRGRASPVTRPVSTAHSRRSTQSTLTATAPDHELPEAKGLIGDDGRIRVSPRIVDELDDLARQEAAAAALADRSFHRPRSRSSVMQDRPLVLDPQLTRFSENWKPSDMNPLEEACWKNRALAFVMAMLQSADCAAPGQKAPAPVPQMIVYGRDSAEEVLRKTEDWKRYRE
jgi:hypothetical protein